MQTTNYFTKRRNKRFFFYCFMLQKRKKGKMTTSKDQEMASGLIADRKELLTIPNKLIEADSQTCLKTLLKKNRGKLLMKKKAML
jgi:hypothetical protein